MLRIVKDVLGGDEEEARKVVERGGSEEVKKRLNENTAKAFGEGAFGLPWFVGMCSFPLQERFFLASS